MTVYISKDDSYALEHHGVKGMKWGVRNDDRAFDRRFKRAVRNDMFEQQGVLKRNKSIQRAENRLSRKTGTKGERRAVKRYLNTLSSQASETRGRAAIYERKATKEKAQVENRVKRGKEIKPGSIISAGLAGGTSVRLNDIAKGYEKKINSTVKKYGKNYNIKSREYKRMTQKGRMVMSFVSIAAAASQINNPEYYQNTRAYKVSRRK